MINEKEVWLSDYLSDIDEAKRQQKIYNDFVTPWPMSEIESLTTDNPEWADIAKGIRARHIVMYWNLTRAYGIKYGDLETELTFYDHLFRLVYLMGYNRGVNENSLHI